MMTPEEEYNSYRLEQAQRELDLRSYPPAPLAWTEDIFEEVEI